MSWLPTDGRMRLLYALNFVSKYVLKSPSSEPQSYWVSPSVRMRSYPPDDVPSFNVTPPMMSATLSGRLVIVPIDALS